MINSHACRFEEEKKNGKNGGNTYKLNDRPVESATLDWNNFSYIASTTRYFAYISFNPLSPLAMFIHYSPQKNIRF